MTGLGYFLFSVLLTGIIYAIVYINGGDHRTLLYTTTYFSLPLIAANFIMALYSLAHWFVRHHDEDVAKEGLTFLHATWITALVTFAAYKIISVGGIVMLFKSFR